jgi:hypothetical protein
MIPAPTRYLACRGRLAQLEEAVKARARADCEDGQR